MCVDDSDIVVFDDYQIWPQDAAVYSLPSWITRKEQIIKVVAYPQGTGIDDFTYRSDEYRSRDLSWRHEQADTRALSELRIWVEATGLARPYIVAYRPLAEVTADYVTTTANTVPLSSTEADAIVLGVLSELHQLKANKTSGEERAQHNREALRLGREYEAGVRHLRPEWRDTQRQHNRAYGSVA
jgi:hypothetical protein